MGVWIEIYRCFSNSLWNIVTPCVGVWIEIKVYLYHKLLCNVTPCVGVWIEILIVCDENQKLSMSLPAWECGLKYMMTFCEPLIKSHSLRGSVD